MSTNKHVGKLLSISANICNKLKNDNIFIEPIISKYTDKNDLTIITDTVIIIRGRIQGNKLWKDCFDALSSFCTIIKNEFDIDLEMLEVRNDYPDKYGFNARFLVKD